MIHTFTALDNNIALDVESGAVHLLDELGLAVLNQINAQLPTINSQLEMPMPAACPPGITSALSPLFAPADIEEAWRELFTLYTRGELFAPCEPPPGRDKGVLKALCLHVAHDCDLRCGYCFAGTGRYGGARGVMSFDTARAAVDMLVGRSGARHQLEIDFFGGEPLLALDTVRRTVDYVRAHESEWGKRFRFTLTTNGLDLTDDSISYLNREMDNLVLSLDGRRETHDALRKTAAGEGSYDKILSKLLRLAAARGDRDYYVRGTFTARNPDFVDDLLHLADLGFRHLSMEPVVLPDAHSLALKEEHMPTVFDAYDRLLEIMRCRDDFSFFHFTVDLSHGPCIYKRLRGCGAGFAYAAVSPEGDVYPCHQFVGLKGYKLGGVREGTFDEALSERFAGLTVHTKPDCAGCWAKYHCGGGCHAANVHQRGAQDKPYELGCRLQKKRLECAIALQVHHQAGSAAPARR